ncbi:MAG: zinc ribbon domain-containing protein [Pyrinomonadaceae bacterium]|nr:zinc ribbon domain-containing protein [Pyrinomonadaceae bacterium]
MTEPEIARRCLSCGVSIRVRASFCPQCGKPLTPKPVAAAETEDTALLTPDPGAQEFTTDKSKSAATKPLNSEKTGVPPTAFSTRSSARRKQPLQATVGMVHRAEPPRREVAEEDGLNRVERFRQMSSAMIDEASYDPSMRFLLVAAVLFVLFLLLLLLSELMT